MSHRIAKKPSARRRKTFIREWREFRDLTQDRLAERLEMSKAQLSRIETGLQPYSQDFLEACADALGTDPASLIMRNPTDEDSIWTIWDQAKPGTRRQIIEIAKTLNKTG
ncbi:hypothetical protein ASD45_08390 [Pseudolabrys sp. Root1462]|uniref:helix-turn-helix domain-containing protein n=1 Tax=Pseudolabrys sp. Root1462 TaxID=1736466 RepID=UPI000702BF31|nr:helix-turn-helix transcriptional regulator [Pseudolabrys sp. Root1462]KQZ00871.1 hypothetical protein ASD45_08390 [Pseudolabrys sp. Root1462]